MVDARDSAKAHYEAWPYPEPIPDLVEATEAGLFNLDDPAMCRRKLWPRNVEPAALEILVAGCGANQAAHLAFTNPDSHVVGIDISETSLANQQRLKEKHSLDNLDLRQLPLEEVSALNQSFDLVSSTGVLHHLRDPDRGVRSLRDVLAPHGVMSVMLYGYYGRIGVYMLQEALRLLGSEQDTAGLQMVHNILDSVPEWHPVHSYVESAPDLDYDAGFVDTFLHKSDRAYTVPQVLQFARDNGLKFQGWLDNLVYSVAARAPEDDMLRQRAETLEQEDRWSLIELIWHLPATHRFLLCHPDRPEGDYVIDFSGGAWQDYRPSIRPPMDIIASQMQATGSITDPPSSGSVAIERAGHNVALDAFGIAALEHADGATPIREILNATSAVATQAGWDSDQHVEQARFFFRVMADLDHLQFEIP